MALGIFRNLTLLQLQALQANAIAALIAGNNSMIIEASAGDVSTRKQTDIKSEVFWDELNYALDLKGGTGQCTRTAIRYV